MQAALQLGLRSPTCVNYSKGKFEMDTVSNYAALHHQKDILVQSHTFGTRAMGEIDSNLTAKTLKDFLVYINSDSALSGNLSFYTRYLTKIGADTNYVCAELVADWFRTNIHIYTNIIRIIKPSDTKLFVLFGQGHIPILKHLFESNPDFKVVSVESIFK